MTGPTYPSRSLSELTPRQRQIVELTAAGYTRWAIGVLLDMPVKGFNDERGVREEIRAICHLVAGNERIKWEDLPSYFGVKMLGDDDADDDDGELTFLGVQ